jgi:hypothetical protein
MCFLLIEVQMWWCRDGSGLATGSSITVRDIAPVLQVFYPSIW